MRSLMTCNCSGYLTYTVENTRAHKKLCTRGKKRRQYFQLMTKRSSALDYSTPRELGLNTTDGFLSRNKHGRYVSYPLGSSSYKSLELQGGKNENIELNRSQRACQKIRLYVKAGLRRRENRGIQSAYILVSGNTRKHYSLILHCKPSSGISSKIVKTSRN